MNEQTQLHEGSVGAGDSSAEMPRAAAWKEPRRGYPLFVLDLVDSNPAGFDDPQVAFNRVSRQSAKQANDHGT